jgi:hypothetical protein
MSDSGGGDDKLSSDIKGLNENNEKEIAKRELMKQLFANPPRASNPPSASNASNIPVPDSVPPTPVSSPISSRKQGSFPPMLATSFPPTPNETPMPSVEHTPDSSPIILSRKKPPLPIESLSEALSSINPEDESILMSHDEKSNKKREILERARKAKYDKLSPEEQAMRLQKQEELKRKMELKSQMKVHQEQIKKSSDDNDLKSVKEHNDALKEHSKTAYLASGLTMDQLRGYDQFLDHIKANHGKLPEDLSLITKYKKLNPQNNDKKTITSKTKLATIEGYLSGVKSVIAHLLSEYDTHNKSASKSEKKSHRRSSTNMSQFFEEYRKQEEEGKVKDIVFSPSGK